MKRQQWNEESALAEAKIYATRNEFKNGSPGAYRAAQRFGILELACSHMPTPTKLTKESIRQIALKYNTRKEFATKSDSSYRTALRNGYLDEVCLHMERDTKWNRENIFLEASKFSLRDDFYKNSPGACSAAKRLGIFDLACAHMRQKKRTLDKQSVAEIAKNYTTRKEFQRGDKSAYNAGFKKDWLDDICSHMERGQTGFNDNKAGTLYQIKLTMPNGENIWKIGITNGSVNKRLASIGVPVHIRSEISCTVAFDNGTDARNAERKLLRKGREMDLHYDGDPFLRSGNTELFTEPLIFLMEDCDDHD